MELKVNNDRELQCLRSSLKSLILRLDHAVKQSLSVGFTGISAYNAQRRRWKLGLFVLFLRLTTSSENIKQSLFNRMKKLRIPDRVGQGIQTDFAPTNKVTYKNLSPVSKGPQINCVKHFKTDSVLTSGLFPQSFATPPCLTMNSSYITPVKTPLSGKTSPPLNPKPGLGRVPWRPTSLSIDFTVSGKKTDCTMRRTDYSESLKARQKHIRALCGVSPQLVLPKKKLFQWKS